MRAWFQVKHHELAKCRIAVAVDFGEEAFAGYCSTLGAPAARYFEKGGRECRRQWVVRREANVRLFRALWRQLRDVEEGEVREVTGQMPRKAAKVAA